jgi:hypothetical protein
MTVCRDQDAALAREAGPELMTQHNWVTHGDRAADTALTSPDAVISSLVLEPLTSIRD